MNRRVCPARLRRALLTTLETGVYLRVQTNTLKIAMSTGMFASSVLSRVWNVPVRVFVCPVCTGNK